MRYEYIKKEDRLKYILLSLEKNKIRKKEDLADDLGVSARTISRDIGELIKKEYNIKRINGRGGGYVLKKGNK